MLAFRDYFAFYILCILCFRIYVFQEACNGKKYDNTVSQRPNFNINHVDLKGWGEMVNATGNMVQLAPAINQDCKSRRGEIISRTLLTQLPMQESLHLGLLLFGSKGRGICKSR